MSKRELWITPEIDRFFQICSSTPLAADLRQDMQKVINKQKGTQGVNRIGVPPFISRVEGEKVIYWHGPTDGIFYSPRILEKAIRPNLSLEIH